MLGLTMLGLRIVPLPHGMIKTGFVRFDDHIFRQALCHLRHAPKIVTISRTTFTVRFPSCMAPTYRQRAAAGTTVKQSTQTSVCERTANQWNDIM